MDAVSATSGLPFPPGHRQRGSQQPQIGAQRRAPDVLDVHLHHLGEADPPPSIYLPDPGDAGEGGKPLVVPGFIFGDFIQRHGPRTDQTHVSLENVDQLWKLVKTGPAEEATESGEALPVREQFPLFIASVGHGSELEEREWPTVKAGPLLAE